MISFIGPKIPEFVAVRSGAQEGCDGFATFAVFFY
jgi:hypothetical protein